jgi:hypothetical protein
MRERQSVRESVLLLRRASELCTRMFTMLHWNCEEGRTLVPAAGIAAIESGAGSRGHGDKKGPAKPPQSYPPGHANNTFTVTQPTIASCLYPPKRDYSC